MLAGESGPGRGNQENGVVAIFAVNGMRGVELDLLETALLHQRAQLVTLEAVMKHALGVRRVKTAILPVVIRQRASGIVTSDECS